MQNVHIDPEWYVLSDHDKLKEPKCRNVRGPSGMIIGRVLLPQGATRFVAEIFQRGRWQNAGEHNEFDRAVDAAAKPQ